jgi:hypothetical protein
MIRRGGRDEEAIQLQPLAPEEPMKGEGLVFVGLFQVCVYVCYDQHSGH